MLFAPAGLGPPFRFASLRPQMRALGTKENHCVKKEREQLFKNVAGGLAAVSSAIIVLAAEGSIPKDGISSLYLAFVGASIPLLLCFYVCHYEHDGETRSATADHYMGLLFAVGTASAFVGYILLLAVASASALLGFLVGLASGLFGIYKVAKKVRAQQDAETEGSAPGGPAI